MWIVDVSNPGGRERYVFEEEPKRQSSPDEDTIEFAGGERRIVVNRGSMMTIDIRPVTASEIERGLRPPERF